MIELLVVAPVLLLLGLGTVQLGLIYHGKTILNYATFEAARTGAVNHASPEPMRRELAVRLAPLAGGDGSTASAAAAIARSIADLESPVGTDGSVRPATRVEVLSPPAIAFEDWGVNDPVSGRRVIPNSHLRHRQPGQVGVASGLSLADANLLEIEVTHGLELNVPIVGALLREALTLADPENAAWYAADRLPLRSKATVRMQSDVWLAEAEPHGSSVPDGTMEDPGDVTAAPAGEPGDDAPDETTDADGSVLAGEADCGEHGLGGGALPVADSAYADGECGVGSGGYEPGGLPSILGGDAPASGPASSPLC